MSSRPRSFLRAIAHGALLTPVFMLAAAGHAQTTTNATTTMDSTTVNQAITAAQQESASRPLPVTPGIAVHNATGLKTAVVSATDADGNIQHASRALLAANVALSRGIEYSLMPVTDVAGFLKDRKIAYPFTTEDYQTLDKKGKIKRAIVVTVGPGQSSQGAASHSALIEMYDTSTGGLVGRGEGNFLATAANTAISANSDITIPDTGDLELRAIDGAVFAAVEDMMQPAQLSGIVVTRRAYQARLSLGEMGGLRTGSQVEYLGDNGQPIAYGTVISLGGGEALATVAPERAFSQIHVNMPFRTVSIPSAGRAGPTQNQLDEREWNRFERDFGISAALAGGLYLLLR